MSLRHGVITICLVAVASFTCATLATAAAAPPRLIDCGGQRAEGTAPVRLPIFAERRVVGGVELSKAGVKPFVVDPQLFNAERLLASPDDVRALARLKPWTVKPEPSLFIFDSSVIDRLDLDPVDPLGRKPFAFLMRELAKSARDPAMRDPATFIRDWLAEWERTAPNINGWPRETVVDSAVGRPNPILVKWTNDGGNVADVPFRLLAIVNRIDLKEEQSLKNYAGELRFVFAADVGGSRPFLVNLEYAVIADNAVGVWAWAYDWCRLGRMPLGSDAFRRHLVRMLRRVVVSRRPALAQIRTNENMLAEPWLNQAGISGILWELRETRLDGAGLLRQTEVSRSLRPNVTSESLKTFLLQSGTTITTPGYQVPDRDANGASFRGDLAQARWRVHWVTDPAVDLPVQRSFAIRTCDGCHHAETRVLLDGGQRRASSFAHIFVDPATGKTDRSAFLTAAYQIADPRSGVVYHFDEVGRRQCYLYSVVNRWPTTKFCSPGPGMVH